jgi:hypothetical protein
MVRTTVWVRRWRGSKSALPSDHWSSVFPTYGWLAEANAGLHAQVDQLEREVNAPVWQRVFR